MIDILFLTHNRLEFTRASLAALVANTNWDLVRYLWLYDDDSTDGTRADLAWLDCCYFPRWRPADEHATKAMVIEGRFGGPVGVMRDFVADPQAAAIFAKLDNDVIVPPGWLDAALGVMEAHPDLDLLGIEPPASRTRAPWATDQETAPELFADPAFGYAPCDSIGGIGLMRTRAFRDRAPMRPHGPNGVGGFTDWQLANRDVRKGWIVPPLSLFLLDRLPMAPWAGLSREYIAKGWQRPWTNYRLEDRALWAWWKQEKAA